MSKLEVVDGAAVLMGILTISKKVLELARSIIVLGKKINKGSKKRLK